jgi:hypothetical protein
MPYDPNLPQAGTEIEAVQMRSQLNGLKDLIDAILTVNATAVDSTTTLPPGSPAQANVSVVGDTLQGEVTQAALDAAILGTSANTNAIGTLDTVFSDPAMEEIRAKINEMILNGRR